MNKNDFENIGTRLETILGLKLIELKRKASGNLINSLNTVITQTGPFSFELRVVGFDYWRVVEFGVPAANVPYDASKRSGEANSQYITGLMNWLKTKGIASDRDTIRNIAFAIATKQTATSRGGFGLGNPIDKNKLGFVRKSQPRINEELKGVARLYSAEIQKVISNAIPSNIEIII